MGKVLSRGLLVLICQETSFGCKIESSLGGNRFLKNLCKQLTTRTFLKALGFLTEHYR